MNELFRMNEHGDIWQEPTLFDQGGEVPETSSSAPRDVDYDELHVCQASPDGVADVLDCPDCGPYLIERGRTN